MKKKNVLMMALSLCLVAVIAVGGTLAFLTDNDVTMTNTFSFANNITVEQTETWSEENRVWNETAVGKGDDTGLTYTNLVAGQTAYKAPVVTVTTEIPTYVFVEVTVGDKVSIVENAVYSEGTGLGTWKTDPALPANTYYMEVDKTTAWTLFDTIQFADDATTETTGDIVIKVKAIQNASEFETVKDAYDEVNYPA